MPIAIDTLIKQMKWAERFGLSQFAFDEDGNRITLVREGFEFRAHDIAAPAREEPAAQETAAPAADVTAPVSGVCYLAPDANSEAFVAIGSTVTKGQTLCLVEAMKVMTSVAAERDGVIEAICVEDASEVEAGTVLMKVRA